MARRQNVIARSVAYAIIHSEDKPKGLLARIPAYFYLYYLELQCYREALFKSLRGSWEIDDEVYKKSFGEGDKSAAGLTAMGANTPQQQYLTHLY